MRKQLKRDRNFCAHRMGLTDALDSLRMRAAAYAVGTVEFLENIRINATHTLFHMQSRGECSFLGHENPFNNKTVLITGGNQGIGFATAKALYQRGSTVVVACRSLSRGQEAVAVRACGASFLRGRR